jgi:hypothetical protein
MFSLVACLLSSLNRFSALIVQHGLDVQKGFVVQNRLVIKMALIALNGIVVK